MRVEFCYAIRSNICVSTFKEVKHPSIFFTYDCRSFRARHLKLLVISSNLTYQKTICLP